MLKQARLPSLTLSYGWVVVGLYVLGSLTGFTAVLNVGVLLPSISSEFGLSPSQQGLLSSSASWGEVALAVPIGLWLSRYQPKRVLTSVMALATLLLLLQAWGPRFLILLAGRVAFGTVLICFEPPGILLIQQWFSQRNIILVNAASSAVFGVVMGIGLVATASIFDSLGENWRTTLYVFTFLMMATTLLWAALGREQITEEYRKREVPREAGTLRGALGYWDLWVASFGFSGAAMVIFAFYSFFPTLMLDTYGISLQWSARILALGLVVGGFSGLGLGILVMKIDKRKGLLKVTGVLMVAGFVGMTLTESIPALLALSFLGGLTAGSFPVLWTVPFLLPGIRPREVAVASAFMIVVSSAGFIIGPMATGYLHEQLNDLRRSLMIVSFAGLSVSAAGLFLRLRAEPELVEQRKPAV